MNLYSDTFDFEKFYNETKDDDMYCIVFNLIEDIECLKEQLAKHDAEVIRDFCSFSLEKYRYDLNGFADEFNQLRQKSREVG